MTDISFEDGSIVPTEPAPTDPGPTYTPVDAPADAPAPDAPVDAPVTDVPVPDVPTDTPAPDAPATDVPAPDAPTDFPTDFPTDTPVPDGITFDKEVYQPGEVVTATVTVSSQFRTRSVTYTPESGQPLTASFKVQEPVGTIEDDGSGSWSLVEGSYTSDTAQFTTTA